MEARFHMLDDLYIADQKLRRACAQIIQLNQKMKMLNRRLLSAEENGNQRFCNVLQIRTQIVEGMLNVFGEYTNFKKHEILGLRFKLFGERPTEPEINEEDDTDDHEYS